MPAVAALLKGFFKMDRLKVRSQIKKYSNKTSIPNVKVKGSFKQPQFSTSWATDFFINLRAYNCSRILKPFFFFKLATHQTSERWMLEISSVESTPGGDLARKSKVDHWLSAIGPMDSGGPNRHAWRSLSILKTSETLDEKDNNFRALLTLTNC